jgi:hypothetical protein
MSVKRLNYESIRISTVGGTIECTPNGSSWKISFTTSKEAPRTSHGKSLEEASESLIKDLQIMVDAIKEDLRAFAERNK